MASLQPVSAKTGSRIWSKKSALTAIILIARFKPHAGQRIRSSVRQVCNTSLNKSCNPGMRLGVILGMARLSLSTPRKISSCMRENSLVNTLKIARCTLASLSLYHTIRQHQLTTTSICVTPATARRHHASSTDHYSYQHQVEFQAQCLNLLLCTAPSPIPGFSPYC
jgi:hypothetical protein